MREDEARWKAPYRGRCAVCRRPGLLIRHHVVLRQIVRREGGNEWDLRNALGLGARCACHERHHHPGVNDTRIPLVRIPCDAIDFAAELLGPGAAHNYFRRRYSGADPRVESLVNPTEEEAG